MVPVGAQPLDEVDAGCSGVDGVDRGEVDCAGASYRDARMIILHEEEDETSGRPHASDVEDATRNQPPDDELYSEGKVWIPKSKLCLEGVILVLGEVGGYVGLLRCVRLPALEAQGAAKNGGLYEGCRQIGRAVRLNLGA